MNGKELQGESAIKKNEREKQLFALENALSNAKSRAWVEKGKHESVQKTIEAIRDLLPCAVFTIDMDLRITSWNRYAEKITGYAEDEALGVRCPDFAGTPCRDICDLFSCAPGEGKSRDEDAITAKDGRKVEIKKSFSLLRDAQGDVVGGIETFEDITRHKKLLGQLRMFRRFAETSSQGIAMAELDGTITYVNPSLCAFLEAEKAEDVIGKKFFPYHPQETQKRFRNEVIPVTLEKGSWTGELELISPGGKRTPTLNHIFLLKDGVGNAEYLANIIVDITVRKNAEEQLREAYEKLKESQEQVVHSAKMAAVGQLAGGVAHEVKNPLAVILHCVEYLGMIKETDVAARDKMLKMIKNSVRTADNIVRGLLDFSRPEEPKFETYNLKDIVLTALELVDNQLNLTDIKVEKELADDLPNIMVDRSRMEQVFVNLIINAVHAMPGGGVLTLKTHAKELDVVEKGVGRRESDKFKIGDKAVVFELGDTGTGILPENLEKIFNPFYSTKAPGEGTGLGLSIAKTIVDQHNGFISMNSEVGKGTTVKILIPLFPDSAG